VTVASDQTSSSGVVDHEEPGRAATAAPTAASMRSIGNLWSRREVQSRTDCLGCSS
jgi:hypothetical protein